MFSRIAYTWRMMGASWRVLKKDPEMMVFSALSGICCIIVLLSFALPIMGSDMLKNAQNSESAGGEILMWVLLFAYYFCSYFVIIFFNAAIISCTIKRLGGGDPTLGDGFRFAGARLPQILGWALVSATVGLILRMIESKSERVGQFVAGLLGMAWTLVTYLVVPVLVVEQLGPIESVKRSASLLKETWGDQVVGNFSFGAIFFVLGLLAIPLGFIGAQISVWVAVFMVVGYVLLLALVNSTLSAIFQAAIYSYATTGAAPEEFGQETLQGAMS